MIGTMPMIIYIHIGKTIRVNYGDGERERAPYLPHCNLAGMMVRKGNHPHVRPYFRFVKYCNLPRVVTILRYRYHDDVHNKHFHDL